MARADMEGLARHPDPVKVEVGANGIPSDAIVLFDGSAASIAKNWHDQDGGPSKWTLKDGTPIEKAIDAYVPPSRPKAPNLRDI